MFINYRGDNFLKNIITQKVIVATKTVRYR
nr:MAG TPA: hypothetical protein [Caudoviricetes sp.]